MYQKRPAQEAVEQESGFAALRKRLASARSVADVLNRNDPFFTTPNNCKHLNFFWEGGEIIQISKGIRQWQIMIRQINVYLQ